MAGSPSCSSTGHVVFIPYPGFGHIKPLICLSHHLSSLLPNILISFVVTEEWSHLIASDPSPRPPNLHLRSIPNVIPSEKIRALDFPAFLEAVCTNMADPVDRLLDQLPLPISYIVADTHLTWAVDIGNKRKIPVASVFIMSPAVFSILYHYDLIESDPKWRLKVSDDDGSSGGAGEERLDCIPGISSIRMTDLPFADKLGTLHRALEAFSAVSRAQCVVFTSFYELDTQTIDSLRSRLPMPIYTPGPSIPYLFLNQEPSPPKHDHAHSSCINFLNDQPKCSVLYVSSGSFLRFSEPQIEELLAGVISSGVRFLWIGRGDHFARVSEATAPNGLVIPWCDQLRVLCHPSIGGFLTHGGWNSTLEAVYAGVPLIALPIIWDQLTNAKYMEEEWKIGIGLKREAGDGGVVKADKISEAVRRVMDLGGEESKELRRNARELQESCKTAIGRDGSSLANLEAFVREIVRGHGN